MNVTICSENKHRWADWRLYGWKKCKMCEVCGGWIDHYGKWHDPESPTELAHQTNTAF